MSDNMKRGDLFTLTKQLRWDDGTPIDLTTVKAVIFIMRLDGETDPVVYDECQIDDAANGIVSYEFKQGETEVPGMYRYEFEIQSFAKRDEEYRPFTVPSSGRYWMHIEGDLA